MAYILLLPHRSCRNHSVSGFFNSIHFSNLKFFWFPNEACPILNHGKFEGLSICVVVSDFNLTSKF